MWKVLVLLSVLSVATCLNAAPAYASEAVCGDRSEFITALYWRAGEIPLVQLATADGSVLEVFGNPASGSWTVMSTSPAAVTCLIAAGEKYFPQTELPGTKH